MYEGEQSESTSINSAQEGQSTPQNAGQHLRHYQRSQQGHIDSARDHFLIVTQNIQDLRGADEKLEYIAWLEQDKNMQAY